MAFRKQLEIETNIREYTDQVLACTAEFGKSTKEYFRSSDRKRILKGYRRIHEAEGRADDIRRDIEVMMYSKAVFPESRGDILGLLETLDRVPNSIESSVRMIGNQHIVIPEDLHEQFAAMVATTTRCVEELVEAVLRVFMAFSDAMEYVGRVDRSESEVDRQESELIEAIFAGSYKPLNKILLRDLATRIGSISDRAERVGDRIRIIVAKRNA